MMTFRNTGTKHIISEIRRSSDRYFIDDLIAQNVVAISMSHRIELISARVGDFFICKDKYPSIIKRERFVQGLLNGEIEVC